jgi:hypothetical protein
MANVCLYDGGNETSKEPYLNFFPTVEQMENYTMGKLVTDEVRLQLADLKVLKQRDLSLWPRAWIESTCTSYLCTAVTCWKYLFLAATTISSSVFVFDTDFYVFIYVQAGIPYRVATLQSSHDTYDPISPSSEMPDDYQSGMPTHDYFELLYQESLSTGAVTGSDMYARPLKWTMLARNQVISAHTEHWVIRYLNYEPIDSEEENKLWKDWMNINFGRDCPEDDSVEVGKRHELKMNRLGLLFSSSYGRDQSHGKTQNSQFDAFMIKYNKQYSTEEEYQYRKSIHDVNVDKIQKLNEIHAGRTSAYGYGNA